MIAEVILDVADIVLTFLGLYCAYKFGYWNGSEDTRELFRKEESEVTK